MGLIHNNGVTTRANKQPSLCLPLAAGGVREGASASSLYYYVKAQTVLHYHVEAQTVLHYLPGEERQDYTKIIHAHGPHVKGQKKGEEGGKTGWKRRREEDLADSEGAGHVVGALRHGVEVVAHVAIPHEKLVDRYTELERNRHERVAIAHRVQGA